MLRNMVQRMRTSRGSMLFCSYNFINFEFIYLLKVLLYLIIVIGREFEHVRESMRLAISMNKTEVLDTVLNDFSEVK